MPRFGEANRMPSGWRLWKPSGANTIDGAIVLNQDFKEFLALLARHDVRYLIVGGYSVALHGYPRYTRNLDVWVLTDERNVQAIVAALDEFGFGSLGLKAADFREPGRVVQLGRPPARIDLLTSLTGVEFADCWQNKVDVDVDGIALPVISLDDLRVNKRALGRHQDLADLENLE
jgi:Nucleotidyltransferase of unknown function (DUF6036)